MTKVYIYEMDAFMGQKLDEIKEFEFLSDALVFCDEFNSKNDKDHVPVWYMVALMD